MYRLTACLTCLLALPALAAAQGVVVTSYYAPPPPVITYYTPAPVVTAYAPPAVSYYRTPEVVTYRYPLLRPRTTVVRVHPSTALAVAPAPVVTPYYLP